MKRKSLIIMSLVLVLALCVGCLVACNKGLGTDQLDKLYREFKKAHEGDAQDSPSSYWVEGSVFYLDDDANEVTANVKWTIEGTTLVTVGTETNAMGQYQIIVPTEVDQDVNYKLVGTLVDKDGNAYKDKDGNEYRLEIAKSIAAGKAYKLAIRQRELGVVLYAKAAKAESSEFYIGSVETAIGGADFYTENVAGGKKIYTMNGSTKCYLGAAVSGTHNNIVLGGIVNDNDAANYAGSVWTVSENEISTVLDGKTMYLGTKNDFNTFSIGENNTHRAFLVDSANANVKAEAYVRVSDQNKNCTVAITSHTVDGNNPLIVEVGTTVTFTVTPEANYEIITVKNGETTLTATDGTYSVNVEAGVTIVVDSRPLNYNGEQSPVTGTINDSIPVGWTYITNNSEFPDPKFYGNGSLQMKYLNVGITSPELDGATGDITITLNIKSLNAKSNDLAASSQVFKIVGLDENGEEVVTTYLDSVTVSDNNTVTLQAGSATIKTIKIIFNSFASNGSKECNVGLGGVTISWGAAN